MGAARWWYRLGLTARVLSIVLVLLLVVQAAVFATVRTTLMAQARKQMVGELALGERMWSDRLAGHVRRLREGAQWLASDHRFVTRLEQQDMTATRAALDSNAQRVGARVTALFDNNLRLSATQEYDELFLLWLKSASYPQMDAGATDVPLAENLRRIARDLVRQRQESGLILVDGAPFQFVLSPVRPERRLGWLLMGFPIDQRLIDDMRDLISVRMAVLVDVPGQPSVVLASSLPDSAREALQHLTPQQNELDLEDDSYAVRHVALDAQGGALRVVLLRSYAEVLAPFRRLQWWLALITVVGLGLFALASWNALRRVTRPLRQLESAARVLQGGRFDVRVDRGPYRDEVGRLAQGFDQMRLSLAGQQAEILRQAMEDALTGLPNRRSFVASVQDAVRQPAHGVAVVVLSLDRFKHVNQVLGFGLGDDLLRAVAQRLKDELAAQGCGVARIGGDEFGVLQQPGDESTAQALAWDLSKALALPFSLNGQTVDLSVSCGVAAWATDGDDAETLIARAQLAMHAAKRRTCGVLPYSPELDAGSAQTLSLLSDLRRALEADQLRLFLQPKCAIADGRLVGAEALLRWQHPERGLVPPGDFIPFAEQTGFIRALTWWVLEQVAQVWPKVQATGQSPRVLAVNLSTRDLMDADFPGRLSALLHRYGVPASGLCLEITESAIMDDPARAQTTLLALSAAGFKLSIDDFGTGYSSLAYLKHLPVDELKIDKSFVMGMVNDPSDAKIVHSTVDLAHNLGLSVVAEGVEDAAVLALLQQLRCDVGQGYHWSKPVPMDVYVRWAQDGRITESPPAAALAPQA